MKTLVLVALTIVAIQVQAQARCWTQWVLTSEGPVQVIVCQ